jgi:iron complex outermembrane receptor protein
MSKLSLRPARLAARRIAGIALSAALALTVVALLQPARLHAQSSAALTGTILDPRGTPLPGASIVVRSATGAAQRITSDTQGKFSFAALAPGKYTLSVIASGFSVATQPVQITSSPLDLPITLALDNVSQEITVEANEAASVAAALAPMDALLSETSARTEITLSMIQNFMSPVADYGEAVQMAPNTFTISTDGVGLGQSKTVFRGFPDGDYDIDFDGVPFYDTNTPSHHSWAFFPSQWLGGIDFDRSPGTASTIGPTPFGGSIHLLSRPFDPVRDIRGEFSGGSWNTFLYDGEYDTGAFGPGHKFNLMLDYHHMTSDGYQTFNFNKRDAGDIQFLYKLSDKTSITGYSGVIQLTSNTPNFNPTRCQMYGAQSAPCTGTLAPFAGSGINFLNTNNNDGELYLDAKYNFYHVPTDFEYVGIHREFAKGVTLDIKPYTYNYDNAEKYTNAVPITDDLTQIGTTYAPLNFKIVNTCGQLVKAKYICGVDKYNSYRKYGETSQLSQVSHFGILRAGMWYEWANTNRHQYPADPLQNWLDAPLPNFSETYVTNSYQPFAEYEFHITNKLSFTPGVKFAYYTIGTKQYADNGGKIGPLAASTSVANPAAFIANAGSYFATLPSGSLNYRIRSNWSAYVQAAQGSIVPPSAVFDFTQSANGTPVATLPKQQKNTTYQTGTVVKLKNVTFDADVFRIHFDNTYSDYVPASTGEPVYYLTPSTVTEGLEGESNIYITHGLSLYLNASYDNSYYQGILNVACTAAATNCTSTTPQLTFTAPGGLNVAQTPSDIETEALTYQHKAFDVGFFNKRVGTQYVDDAGYHNQATIDPFNLANLFVNYTLRSGGRFDQTKLRLSLNNVFNSSAIDGNTPVGTPVPLPAVAANNTSYVNPFATNGQAPVSGGDQLTVLAGRSMSVSIIFGFSPRR